MENFISGRAESCKSAITCCGGEDSTSVDSKDSMLEAGEYLERLSFWQRPRQKVDLEFVDVTYRVKQGRKGEQNFFFRQVGIKFSANMKAKSTHPRWEYKFLCNVLEPNKESELRRVLTRFEKLFKRLISSFFKVEKLIGSYEEFWDNLLGFV